MSFEQGNDKCAKLSIWNIKNIAVYQLNNLDKLGYLL